MHPRYLHQDLCAEAGTVCGTLVRVRSSGGSGWRAMAAAARPAWQRASLHVACKRAVRRRSCAVGAPVANFFVKACACCQLGGCPVDRRSAGGRLALNEVSLTTKGFDHKTPIRTSLDQKFNRYSQPSLPQSELPHETASAAPRRGSLASHLSTWWRQPTPQTTRSRRWLRWST